MKKPLWVIAGVQVAILLGLIYMVLAVANMAESCSNAFPLPLP